MKKTNKTIITTAAIAIVATAAPLSNAFAATTPSWNGDVNSATLVRQIANAYGTINNTFSYTVTADADNPTGVTGAPSFASIAFNETYATQGTASKTTSLDFSNMQFSAVGDYYYTITESSSSPNASVYPASSSTYKVLVEVRNNDTLTGYVARLYVKHIDESSAEEVKLTDISGGDSQFVFAASPAYTNIQVSATASGNAADPNKCFDYKLSFSTPDSYVVNTDSTCGNPSEVANGDTIKLKANDTVTIGINGTNSQIPVGTVYSITKDDTTDGYTSTIDGVEQNTSGEKTSVAINNPTYNTSNKTTIDEHLDLAVNSGVVMNIAIYVILAIAGVVGIYYATRKKSNKEA